ncbi:Uncharacterized conserved protein YbbK, DUF523 family [Actinomyces ruminicola]|uniref:Uncharacterized conserved protein YbbK, DUF523 family n=1 Tax=Actinomyces ruminicola TaxID=332524 RepID=A0A1H0BXM8_9ACTO|nr:DUF523 domain-containing protein [Actinomyces ruminicola]SDN50449.1 Uncharacterized conserved protein YbbK, DUF523 family [Actinomyces ruminicola]
MNSSSRGGPLLVSACLAGFACRYDGAAKPDRDVVALAAEGLALPLCAEIVGGLPIPRPPAEIVGGDGGDVLDGNARVVTRDGEDVTDAFIRGADAVATVAVQVGCPAAVLQERSPSCGVNTIYDGTHSGRRKEGSGVLTAALHRRGIAVVTTGTARERRAWRA